MTRDPNRFIWEGKMNGEEKGEAPTLAQRVLWSLSVVVKNPLSVRAASWLWEGRKPRKSVSVGMDRRKF